VELGSLLVMHIEDNDDHADLVLAALTQISLPRRVIRFIDAESGLDYLFGDLQSLHRSQYPFPDLILLDISLPGMGGLEFLQTVRMNQHTKGIPVVIISASVRQKEIARAYDCGANSYIIKPIGYDEFVIKLAELNMYWFQTAEVPAQVLAMPDLMSVG
jgi:two-component system response regulator